MGRKKADHLMYMNACKTHKKTSAGTVRRDYGFDCVMMTLEDVMGKCGPCILTEFNCVHVTQLTGDDHAGDSEKRVFNRLADKGWKQLVNRAGAAWKDTKAALVKLDGNFKCYGMWWGRGSTSERFDDTKITTHAFTITKNGNMVTVDGNNMGDEFLKDNEWVSVYVPGNSPVANKGDKLVRKPDTVVAQGTKQKGKR